MLTIAQDLSQVIDQFKDSFSYNNLKGYIDLIAKNESYIANLCMNAIITVLQDNEINPYQKVSAMRVFITYFKRSSLFIQFAKDIMDIHDKYTIEMVQRVILPVLEKIASWNSDNQNDDRGKIYFSSEPSNIHYKQRFR